ncbi:MAG: beta-ketoacyl-[acyl-carrier-protein] synthase family protein [Desulfobulbaceae bacterium]|nr:beta-ketoacyl-[acyl-carrier-protein] synthase family protein [Desulfobulbaceae bacterium]
MNTGRVYIAGAGLISPLGHGLAATEQALRTNRSAIRPLDLFSLLHGTPLPVGQVNTLDNADSPPRTHRLAGNAAIQAMTGSEQPPDAIVIGTTTGGILTTEQLLRDKVDNKDLYRQHGLGTVAEYLAEELNCDGPVLTVSTACSSGAVAITLAMAMLRRGSYTRILAGGVDSLCRLTYYGFHSLQLVDRNGCRPLDAERRGMAVAEGAGMLLLTTEKPVHPLAEVLGAGLSCDAYHPAAPHPEGRGALEAMQAALADAGLDPGDIDYINLHGTGTPENDLAESKAINNLFTDPPPLSSIKGATGHSLAAAGALEAVVATLAITKNLLPANTGLKQVDPALDLAPLTEPCDRSVSAVLSNSFGFGGNNGSLVIAQADTFPPPADRQPADNGLAIFGYSCLTGAGGTRATLDGLQEGKKPAGMADLDVIAENLPPRLIRRLKRLPQMALSLALSAHESSKIPRKPSSIFMGTGWGALSETYDFLTRLAETDEQFPSPTDFVCSVHNGPAGQVALLLGATGANITTSGGDYSFEQALLSADLLLKDRKETALVLGADETHAVFSPLLDPSIGPETRLADGGGGLHIGREREGAACRVRIPFFRRLGAEDVISALIAALGGQERIQQKYILVLVGIPAAMHEQGEQQLKRFLDRETGNTPVVRYREFTGEFASASAVAAVMAASFFETGVIPGTLLKGDDMLLADQSKRILVLGLGQHISAMEFFRP